ncbi:hypothetical protein [Sphingomonas rubra]|uniref:Uncharacterized protein n=1 Tax=Sphingomonas rubra TaxID=634430 RepID=A0A1I5SWC8_9SPHN|nr:hypothetical protein [Sphingomonas rubra]SFP75050.1 hypothetical protein SAMN04488241_106198 [Sphingomonas rubra]
MADERITTSDMPPHTTIIERRSSGGTVLLAVVLLIAVLIGGFYLFSRQSAQNGKDAAITSAAKSVGGAADKVGDAVGGEK